MTKGERIKQRREQLGISQTELAECIGTSKQNLYKYENDIITNIPSDRVEALAKRLNTSPAYIMGWNEGDSLPSPTITEDAEVNEYLEILRTRPEMKMMFQLAKGATKEDVEKAVRVIEAMFGKDTKGD